MTLNYFKPTDLKRIEGTFNYKAKTGIGFAITPDDEQVFITARDVDQLGLDIGDSVVAYAVDNYSKPETAHFTSRWRAVRVELVSRITDIVSHVPNVTPVYAAPAALATPTDFVGTMDLLMADARPWTVNELTHAIVRHSPALSALPELLQKVGGRLATMHKNGEVACVKVYAKAEQDRASAVYYAKNVDVFYDHLETPLEGE